MGFYKSSGTSFNVIAPDDPKLVKGAMDQGVEVLARLADEEMPALLAVLINWFPMLLIGVWIFFMRQMQSGGGRAIEFGKSRARLLTEKTGRVTLKMSPVLTKRNKSSRKSSSSAARTKKKLCAFRRIARSSIAGTVKRYNAVAGRAKYSSRSSGAQLSRSPSDKA